MFRIVTDFLTTDAAARREPGKPFIMLVCDSRNCWQQLSVSITFDTLASPAALSPVQEKFLREAVEQGWLIGWDAIMCPGHFKRILAHNKVVEEERLKKEEKLVQLARSIPVPKDFTRRN